MCSVSGNLLPFEDVSSIKTALKDHKRTDHNRALEGMEGCEQMARQRSKAIALPLWHTCIIE